MQWLRIIQPHQVLLSFFYCVLLCYVKLKMCINKKKEFNINVTNVPPTWVGRDPEPPLDTLLTNHFHLHSLITLVIFNLAFFKVYLSPLYYKIFNPLYPRC